MSTPATILAIDPQAVSPVRKFLESPDRIVVLVSNVPMAVHAASTMMLAVVLADLSLPQHDLERIRERFTVREIKTSRDIADWNQGKIPVAVIHPASAGHGLNLQSGGSTLIWFGLTWSLELYQQTNARLWRQGQKEQTVVIHHIITKNTIDERIMSALQKKERAQSALIDAVKADLEVRK